MRLENFELYIVNFENYWLYFFQIASTTREGGALTVIIAQQKKPLKLPLQYSSEVNREGGQIYRYSSLARC